MLGTIVQRLPKGEQMVNYHQPYGTRRWRPWHEGQGSQHRWREPGGWYSHQNKKCLQLASVQPWGFLEGSLESFGMIVDAIVSGVLVGRLLCRDSRNCWGRSWKWPYREGRPYCARKTSRLIWNLTQSSELLYVTLLNSRVYVGSLIVFVAVAT